MLSAADYDNDNEYPVPHSFKLDFKNGETVAFYCDAEELAYDWCDKISRVWNVATGKQVDMD